jgi:IS30 family transposase
VSKLLSTPIQAFDRNTGHTFDVAIATVGHGFGWTLSTFTRGNKFAIVAVEYFTRWIEARPLATIMSETVKKFFWQNIVCRFGVPQSLTVDNGKQFDTDNFKSFYKSIGSKIAFALVYHLESNGAMERVNRIVFSAISKTLFNLRKRKWIEELLKVMWSHNTQRYREPQALPHLSSCTVKKQCYQKKSNIRASAL